MPAPLLETVDVLIVGAGPAGLMASLCLHTFGFSVLHIDNRPEPTVAGRADGIQPRTLEVLRNIGPWIPPKLTTSPHPPSNQSSTLGIAKKLISRGVRVYEASFWDPTPSQPLARTSRARSCPDFIDVRDRYTLLLHQGIIEREFLAEISARAPDSQILRPCQFVSCHKKLNGTRKDISPDYPIEAIIKLEDGSERLVRTKYLLGCDGAKSDVRKSLNGGIKLEGQGTDIVWGVMDCWVESDFPDLKLKCLIHSKRDGSLMVIPRENNLVRFYVQLLNEEPDCMRKTATIETCQEQAKKILHPFTLKFGDTDWFSIYQIGQRIANTYTLDGRIILGGDAVHTHSPKAGQGMNISMLDMFSLAWKINLIEKGVGKREKIMQTYEQERRRVAEELIAFDAEYSKLFSGREGKPPRVADKGQQDGHEFEVDPHKFIRLFKQNAYFTSGCGAVYPTNVFNALADSEVFKYRASAQISGPLKPGERLFPGDATRVVDGNPVRMEQEINMNGAFRIYIFVGSSAVGSRLDHLAAPRAFLHRFRARDANPCSIFDAARSGPNPFFTFLLITSRSRDGWEIKDLPPLFSGPYSSQVYVDDIPNTVAGDESSTPLSLHSKYGFHEGDSGGGILVVRPDGYVGLVVTLTDAGWETVEEYFDGFLIEADE